mmetsp:Transcript_4829/g.16940  ORF Transcript_4829/g.16940 Transcript_4829/m.16940 type:complete len:153 (+) Transcript_4829:57-515(+)
MGGGGRGDQTVIGARPSLRFLPSSSERGERTANCGRERLGASKLTCCSDRYAQRAMVSRAPAAAAAALCALLLVSAIAGQEVTLDDDARTGQKKTRDEDVSRDAFELAASKGYEVEEHRVTTRDGYILKMIRIVGSPNRNSGECVALSCFRL